jgi:hypothetical protein
VIRRCTYRLCCLLMACFSLQAARGLIGSVYTPCDAARDAKVEVIGEADATKQFTGSVDSEGIFRFPDIPPGRYSIRITARGVQDLTIAEVTVANGTLTDVGPLEMTFPPVQGEFVMVCNSPGLLRMMRKLEMIDLCAIDFQQNEPACMVHLGTHDAASATDDSSLDLWLQVTDDGTWLVPLNQGAFSLNPSTVTDKGGCINATYAPGRVRIDSLPSGSRLCVLTRTGGYAELRFIGNVTAKQPKVTLEYMWWP